MHNKKRGSLLESVINKTIAFYERNNVGLFHKKNLDVAFQSVTTQNNKPYLNNGYILKKSTVDYYGVLSGFFIAFEAKSTNQEKLP
jgi:recombination protein U